MTRRFARDWRLSRYTPYGRARLATSRAMSVAETRAWSNIKSMSNGRPRCSHGVWPASHSPKIWPSRSGFVSVQAGSVGIGPIPLRLISNLYARPRDIGGFQDVGSNMSNKFWLTAAILVPSLLRAPCVRADEAVSGRGRPTPPIELCEAFPWDVPIEQSFTTESVMRWRRAMQEQAARQPVRSFPHGRFFARAP